MASIIYHLQRSQNLCKCHIISKVKDILTNNRAKLYCVTERVEFDSICRPFMKTFLQDEVNFQTHYLSTISRHVHSKFFLSLISSHDYIPQANGIYRKSCSLKFSRIKWRFLPWRNKFYHEREVVRSKIMFHGNDRMAVRGCSGYLQFIWPQIRCHAKCR